MRPFAAYSDDMRLTVIVLLTALGLLVGACQPASSTRQGSADTSPAAPAAASQQPMSGSPPASPPSGTDTPPPLTISDDGLSLTVVLSASEVAPGGSVTVEVTVRNDRPETVVLGPGRCGGPASMDVQLPVPLDPSGHSWDGIAAKFKQYALTEGMQPGIVPMSRPVPVSAIATPCFDGEEDVTLQPGATATGSLTWSAQLVKDVPALPGEVPFTVTVAHDPSGTPPSYPPDYDGPGASWFRMYESLALNGTLRIVGDAPPVLTAGQAIDAMLSNKRFAKWLSKQPPSTWSNANVFLQYVGRANRVAPVGPSWDVELFREVGVPRNWAIGAVDAYSGKVLDVTFCNAPCRR